MNHDEYKTACLAVRAAKFLTAHGVELKSFKVTTAGRSIYLKCKMGSMRFTVRFSDHRPSTSRSSTGLGKMASFSHLATWSRVRYLLKSRVAWMTTRQTTGQCSTRFSNHHHKHLSTSHH